MRAGIYCRVSSQGQEDGYSLDDQEAKGRGFCAERGYEVAGVWREVYTGAALFGRPKLMALMGEVERGTVERVILSHPDRQTRDMLDLGWLVREAERHGAKFECVEAETDFGTPEGVIIGGIRAFAAQTTRTINAKKSIDAVRRRVEIDGKLIGGHPPRYGYRFGPETDGSGKPTRERYVIEPEQAETVRFIFEQIAASVPKMTICKELMRRGVPNPGFARQRDRVIRWKPATVEGIVRDEKYRGVAFLFKIDRRMDGR
jgi:site-specific DNA recombinase